ncbi:MAG: hypothetical protein AAF468_18945, partial [Pseudomonadota bacterium]
NHQTGSDRHQHMAETVKSHQATPFTEHAPDRTGNNLKKWPDIRRLDKPTKAPETGAIPDVAKAA